MGAEEKKEKLRRKRGKQGASSDDRPGGDCVNAPVPTALRGVRDGGLHGRPEGEGESETPKGGARVRRRGEWGEACAQGEDMDIG